MMTKTIRTQVGILGAGPAGLLLAHLLGKAGIDSVVIDGKSRVEIEGTIRAGIVESPAAEVLAQSGVSDRIYREGMKHDGIEFHFDGHAHRFDFADLVQKSAYLYPQHEVLKDLIAVRSRGSSARPPMVRPSRSSPTSSSGRMARAPSPARRCRASRAASSVSTLRLVRHPRRGAAELRRTDLLPLG
jgi:hypothetical protein